MELKYPSFSEYQSALQNPRICFKHYPLTDGRIELDLWGLPRVRSGGFALTYKLTNHQRKLAVRCFYRGIKDRMQRYYAISNFIETNGADFLIPVRYLSRGIFLQGKSYPITYMEWVESLTLDEWLVKNHARKNKIKYLADEFLRLVSGLESQGIAHGDLSHRNILYDGKKAVLIDYDGMFVPSLEGKKACELGNPYFQHPGRRDDFFDARIDRFSEIVIYLALTALSHDQELYHRFETGGEGLLFSRKDFLNPYQSPVLREIEILPELKVLVQNFREICLGDIHDTPSLERFLGQEATFQIRSETNAGVENDAGLHPAFTAKERKAILKHEGEIIKVSGIVSEVFWGKEIGGQPHIFINFGNWKKKCFTIVLWDEPLKDFLATGVKPDDLQGKRVSVNGLLTVFNNRPQISLTTLTEMMVEDPVGSSGDKNINSATRQISKPPDPNQIPMWVQVELPVQVGAEIGMGGSVLDRSSEVVRQIDRLYGEKKSKISRSKKHK